MNIVITGATGFVGKWLCAYLAQSHQVFAVVRNPKHPVINSHLSHPNIKIVNQDLSKDLNHLPDKAHILISLAQSSHFKDFPDKASDIFSLNVLATQNLWQWALKAGVNKILHASSGGIYGQSSSALKEDEPITIQSDIGYYLGTKLCSEILLSNYRHLFESIAIFRPFFIYGPGQKPHMLIGRLLKKIQEQSPIQLHEKNGFKFNPVYIGDVIDGFVKALDLKGYHLYNMAGPQALSLREICNIMGQQLNQMPIFEQTDQKPVNYIAHHQSFLELLGHPLKDFSSGLKKTLNVDSDIDVQHILD